MQGREAHAVLLLLALVQAEEGPSQAVNPNSLSGGLHRMCRMPGPAQDLLSHGVAAFMLAK